MIFAENNLSHDDFSHLDRFSTNFFMRIAKIISDQNFLCRRRKKFCRRMKACFHAGRVSKSIFDTLKITIP